MAPDLHEVRVLVTIALFGPVAACDVLVFTIGGGGHFYGRPSWTLLLRSDLFAAFQVLWQSAADRVVSEVVTSRAVVTARLAVAQHVVGVDVAVVVLRPPPTMVVFVKAIWNSYRCIIFMKPSDFQNFCMLIPILVASKVTD